MSTNEAREVSGIAERMTWDEMCQRFPDEWVVFVNADWVSEDENTFGTAEVIGHYKSRKDASPNVKAAFTQHLEVACFWTGEKRCPIPRFIIP